MTRLRMPNGDDHPEAAQKHLLDSAALLLQERPDGAAYLSGYVVECALKSLYLSVQLVIPAKLPWKGKTGHDLNHLHGQVSTLSIVAGPTIARIVFTHVQ